MTGARSLGKSYEVLQRSTEGAVRAWIACPEVRAAVESDDWRPLVAGALMPLDASVGPVDQFGVYWLMLRALGAAPWPREGAPWGDTYAPPKWATSPEVPGAAWGLLKVVTALATELAQKGVPLDPDGTADRAVLAQLVALGGWDWDDPGGMIANLNVASVGSVDDDGRGTTVDSHAGDREERELSKLRRGRLGRRIRAPYSDREGIYDTALWAILAARPDVTADGIIKALRRDDDWVTGLKPFYDGRLEPADFRRMLSRSLKRLKSRIK